LIPTNEGGWSTFGGFTIKSFEPVSQNKFGMYNKYKIVTSCSDEPIIAHLDETLLWSLIYTNKSLYSRLGREVCILLDIAYNLGGTEAVAESYYSVMESQRQDGGQCNNTLDMRTLIDWCMPNVLACTNQISAIAKIYHAGDQLGGVAKHRSPVLMNNKPSKVMTRIQTEKKGLPHLRN